MTEKITTPEADREALRALSTLYNAEDGSREKDQAFEVVQAALAARQPAPTVSAEQVREAAKPIAAEIGQWYHARYRQDVAEASLTEALAALGIEVTPSVEQSQYGLDLAAAVREARARGEVRDV